VVRIYPQAGIFSIRERPAGLKSTAQPTWLARMAGAAQSAGGAKRPRRSDFICSADVTSALHIGHIGL
jgi:hypothetical protein